MVSHVQNQCPMSRVQNTENSIPHVRFQSTNLIHIPTFHALGTETQGDLATLDRGGVLGRHNLSVVLSTVLVQRYKHMYLLL